MTTWRAARRIAAKDLRIELRTRDVLTAMGMFALLIVVVASFAFPTAGEQRETIAAGLLWMAWLFAILLGIGRSLAMEHEEDCLDALLTSPVPRESIYLGKLLSNLAFVGVTQLFLLPVAVVLLQLEPRTGLPLLLLTVAVGTLALVAVTTLFAAMAATTRTREAILPVLVIPVAIPVLVAAVRATEIALSGGAPGAATSWLLLLTAAAALFLLLGMATFRHVLEE
jgi:heme exporter protein B